MNLPLSTLRQTLAVLATTLLAAHAGAATPPMTAAAAADAAYQRELAVCLQAEAPQGRATCLKEAAAAQAEARRGRLDNGEDAATLRLNAELRCKEVAAADREACLRMARGEGTASGSVAGGGVLRSVVTTTVGPAVVVPAPTPAPMPAATR